MAAENELCEHLKDWHGPAFTAKEHVCEECVKTGSQWLHLRTCQTCGATLCCDSSPNQHASRHAARMRHPVAISSERGEQWAWCYQDEVFLEYRYPELVGNQGLFGILRCLIWLDRCHGNALL